MPGGSCAPFDHPVDSNNPIQLTAPTGQAWNYLLRVTHSICDKAGTRAQVSWVPSLCSFFLAASYWWARTQVKSVLQPHNTHTRLTLWLSPHPRCFSRVKHFLKNTLGMTQLPQFPNLSQILLHLQMETPLPGGASIHALSLLLPMTSQLQGEPNTQHRPQWHEELCSQAEAWVAEPRVFHPSFMGRGQTSQKNTWNLEPAPGLQQAENLCSFTFHLQISSEENS